MTEQEFYIWILNCTSRIPKFPINPEFLKNYEIAKLVLEKFGINSLSENQQRNLNPEAVSAWFRTSGYIELQHDIPEILELIPERIVGYLYLKHSEIESLPQMRSVGGSLNLENSEIQSLPELESVGGSLDLSYSEIQSLPKLESVGGGLYFYNSKIQFLPKLESVGRSIFVREHQYNYWKNYFNETGRPHLANKVHQ